jgi:hypothetical protein
MLYFLGHTCCNQEVHCNLLVPQFFQQKAMALACRQVAGAAATAEAAGLAGAGTNASGSPGAAATAGASTTPEPGTDAGPPADAGPSPPASISAFAAAAQQPAEARQQEAPEASDSDGEDAGALGSLFDDSHVQAAPAAAPLTTDDWSAGDNAKACHANCTVALLHCL